jgi:hypothetical protein
MFVGWIRSTTLSAQNGVFHKLAEEIWVKRVNWSPGTTSSGGLRCLASGYVFNRQSPGRTFTLCFCCSQNTITSMGTLFTYSLLQVQCIYVPYPLSVLVTPLTSTRLSRATQLPCHLNINSRKTRLLRVRPRKPASQTDSTLCSQLFDVASEVSGTYTQSASNAS